MERKCLEAVDALKTKGINFVCIDFDQTIVDVHTGGQWRGSVGDLEKRIRPFFRRFIPALIAKSMLVSIVTFSGQVALITDVMKRDRKSTR